MSRAWLAGAVAFVALGAVSAQGAVVTEYFNGYDTATGDLAGRNGGSGWAAAWAGSTFPDFGPLAVNSAFNLTYTAPGYSNVGNSSTLSDGLAMYGGDTAGSVATRSVQTGGTADTGLTGTVWMSCLVNSGSDPVSDMLLWIDRPDVTNSYVAIRDRTARLRYNAVDIAGTTNEYAVNTTYLLLAKVVLNASGTNDTLSLWINPNLSGGEAGLGTPKLAGANNANAFGNAISGIGVSFEGFGKLDSIRLSNDADGFNDVTMVPEPGMAGTVGAMMLAGLAKRRRRA